MVSPRSIFVAALLALGVAAASAQPFPNLIGPGPIPPTFSAGNNTIVSVTATGTTNVGSFSQTVAINTASASAVSIVLPASASFPSCPSLRISCPVITVKDVSGDASTGLISVSASDSKLLDGLSSYALPFPQQSASFVLLGSSWGVQ